MMTTEKHPYLGRYFNRLNLCLLYRFGDGSVIYHANPGDFFQDDYGFWWLRTDPGKYFTNQYGAVLPTYCGVAFDGDPKDYLYFEDHWFEHNWSYSPSINFVVATGERQAPTTQNTPTIEGWEPAKDGELRSGDEVKITAKGKHYGKVATIKRVDRKKGGLITYEMRMDDSGYIPNFPAKDLLKRQPEQAQEEPEMTMLWDNDDRIRLLELPSSPRN
ncbi:KOW motif domain-containing protein [Roseofilum sp. BLCC_M154]|uniref:KOW motif domain-containing protein n=1 Tax=Roseofilum acuticapitatum BLCC-M154 TaxID=3022444 RepID=A0ABT7AS00_9CYAN|nr:KOW motif domain-containing protein [Roseofilum acuticapitatum]MDJ1169679.1 KOW motif domain-containing protein [Roseofilum acuticapitatum BLCC-M154]